ncbi:MAG: polyprenol monophosphomannose synthase [Jatrophihabitans sp.]
MSEQRAASEHQSDSEQRVLVVIPTYNERDNIRQIIDRLFTANPDVDALIVDDGSPDGTGALVDALVADDDRVHVLHRREKAGLGAAYIAGFGWALQGEYDVIVEMDADGSHAPEQLPHLLTALADADVVLGSRWVRGGKVANWPMTRAVLSVGGNVYTRLALGLKLRDATGGYRVYRRNVLESFDLASVASQGYCFQVDLAWRAVRAGFRVVEVPITFTERERGESKMSQNIVREALGRVTVWGVSHRAEQVRGVARRLSRRSRR